MQVVRRWAGWSSYLLAHRPPPPAGVGGLTETVVELDDGECVDDLVEEWDEMIRARYEDRAWPR